MVKNSIYSYFKNNRVKNPINITLTEKKCDLIGVFGEKHSEWNDANKSSQNYRHFKNLLNTKVFGKSYKRFGVELQMVVIREIGQNGQPHLHCIIEQSPNHNLMEFMMLVNSCWQKTKFGYQQTHFEKPIDDSRAEGWLNYILKNSTKLDGLEDSIDWCNCTV